MSQLRNSSQYSRLQRCAALQQCICINQSILGYCSLIAETHERAIKFTAGVLGNMLLQNPRPDPH